MAPCLEFRFPHSTKNWASVVLPVTPSLGRQQQRILWASCLGGLAESGSAGLIRRFCLNRKGEKAGEMTQRVKEPADRPVLEIWLA